MGVEWIYLGCGHCVPKAQQTVDTYVQVTYTCYCRKKHHSVWHVGYCFPGSFVFNTFRLNLIVMHSWALVVCHLYNIL